MVEVETFHYTTLSFTLVGGTVTVVNPPDAADQLEPDNIFG